MRTRIRPGGPRFGTGVILALLLVVGSVETQVSVPQDPQQCYRQIDEPANTCSICKDQCLGRGYVCCGIIAYT